MTKKVVHLSSVLSVDPMKSFNAFVKLEKACAQYQRASSKFSFALPFSSHKAIVDKKKIVQPLIDEYKLGTKNTTEFLEEMLKQFPLLEAAIQSKLSSLDEVNYDEISVNSPFLPKKDFLSEKLEEIEKYQDNYYVFHAGIETEINPHSLALALIEDAFNALIDFDDKNRLNMADLIDHAQNDSVLFFANTNPLNLFRACTLMHEYGFYGVGKKNFEKTGKNAVIDLLPIDKSFTQGKIIPMSIATSYCFETLSLVEPLFEQGKVNQNDEFISPYPQDLQKVKAQVGEAAETRIHSAQDYFDTKPKSRFCCA
jgi:hypothetical protein